MRANKHGGERSRVTDLGIALLRVGVGGTLFAHGTQKLFGWFGGHGIEGASKGFEAMGFVPGREHAIAAGASEAGSGALLVLGLATPLAGIGAAGTMAVAGSTHAKNGFFGANGGYELAMLLGLASASVSLAGPGRYSIDRLSAHRLGRRWMIPLSMAVVAPSVAMILKRREETLVARERSDASTGSSGASGSDVADQEDIAQVGETP